MDGDSLTARFIMEIKWSDLPEAVQSKAKMCLLDNLAATISGGQAAVSRIATEFASSFMAGQQATILVQGKKASTAGAGFANASAANGLDTDDGARYAYGHAGAQVFPAALAVTETEDLSGADRRC